MLRDMRQPYADGVKDGFKITLLLLLGEPASGGEPYRGPVPSELRVWVEDALKKIEEVER